MEIFLDNKIKLGLFIFWLIISSGIFLIFIGLIFLSSEEILKYSPSCMSKKLYNKSCFFCGMTRSFISIFNFDYIEADKYNKLGKYLFIILLINELIFFKYIFFILKKGWKYVCRRND